MDDEFQEHSRMRNAKQRGQDFDDLQLELSGQDAGRMQRHGVGPSGKQMLAKQNEERFRQQLSALDRLLKDDPVYAALYEGALDLLSNAEVAAETALEAARADFQDAEQVLQDTQDGANQLPDGTRIYKDADGNVWTEDGQLVSKDQLGGVVWKDGAASYEDYIQQKQAVEDAKGRITDIEDYLYNVLGPARDKLTDPDNPPSKDDLERIKGDIQTQAPAIMQFEHEVVSTGDFENGVAGSKLDLPKI